jgi:hypothetical protein
MPVNKPTPARKQEDTPQREEWWTALKLVALRTLSKSGNLPFVTLCLTLLAAIFLWKIPAEHLIRLAELFLLNNWLGIMGWSSFAIMLFTNRYQESMHKREVERITEERNKYQAMVIPNMKSSTAEQIVLIEGNKNVN